MIAYFESFEKRFDIDTIQVSWALFALRRVKVQRN